MLAVAGTGYHSGRVYPSGGGSGGTYQGSLSLGGNPVLSKGKIQLLASGVSYATAAVDGSGNYSFTSLAPGTYTSRLQPHLSQSLGPSETDHTFTIANGQTLTQNFVSQAALGFDDFQSYTTDAQLRNGTTPIPAGDFWSTVAHGEIHAIGGTTRISLDTTGGPLGDKAVKYHLPTLACPACTGTPNVAFLGPAINVLPVGMTSVSARWVSKESAPWNVGCSTCTGSSREYKFFLLQLGPCPNGCPQIGVYLEQNSNGTPVKIVMDVTDRVSGNINTNHALTDTLPNGWDGQYHSWVINAYGLTTANATFELWMDDKLIRTLTGAFMNGTAISGLLFPNIGEQMNNGPDADQDRWIGEVAVAQTRLSTLTGRAL